MVENKDGRVIPLIELQYFEVSDGQETLIGAPFFWDGNNIDILPSILDTRLKARLRLYYCRPGARYPSLLGPAADEAHHIMVSLHGCGDSLQAKILQ